MGIWTDQKKDAVNYKQILTEVRRPEQIDDIIENDNGARACLEIWACSLASDSLQPHRL